MAHLLNGSFAHWLVCAFFGIWPFLAFAFYGICAFFGILALFGLSRAFLLSPQDLLGLRAI
jgi:hypothetical protein